MGSSTQSWSAMLIAETSTWHRGWLWSVVFQRKRNLISSIFKEKSATKMFHLNLQTKAKKQGKTKLKMKSLKKNKKEKLNNKKCLEKPKNKNKKKRKGKH